MTKDDLIPREVLESMLFDLFQFAPLPISISTAGGTGSRYLKVNDAFLALIGRRWEEICNEEILKKGTTADSPARQRRLALLDEVGSYHGEEVELRHSSGAAIPTLISARRYRYGSQSFDIEVIIDISSRVQSERALEQHLVTVAQTDALTGLPNRAHFDRYLDTAIAEAQQGGQLVALAFLDLNGFKQINDRFGHATGDDVLRAFARRLRTKIRSSDFVARIGGDEFAIVFRVARGDADSLTSRVDDIVGEISQPIRLGDRSFEVGAAVGLSVQEGAACSASALFRSADEQMYAAKSSARPLSITALPARP